MKLDQICTLIPRKIQHFDLDTPSNALYFQRFRGHIQFSNIWKRITSHNALLSSESASRLYLKQRIVSEDGAAGGARSQAPPEKLGVREIPSAREHPMHSRGRKSSGTHKSREPQIPQLTTDTPAKHSGADLIAAGSPWSSSGRHMHAKTIQVVRQPSYRAMNIPCHT